MPKWYFALIFTVVRCEQQIGFPSNPSESDVVSRLLRVNWPYHKYFLNSSLYSETFFILDPFSFSLLIWPAGWIKKRIIWRVISCIAYCWLVLIEVCAEDCRKRFRDTSSDVFTDDIFSPSKSSISASQPSSVVPTEWPKPWSSLPMGESEIKQVQPTAGPFLNTCCHSLKLPL